jgi:methylamine dehydrogenase accessory protein MauD
LSGWWLASYVILWVLVALLCVAVLALARQVGTLHLRLGPRGALEVDEEGPPLGEAPEPVEAHDSHGRSVPIGGPGTPQLLLFVSPGCPVCREVLPSVEAAARMGSLAPVVVSDTDVPVSEILPGVRAAAPVVVRPDVAASYRVPGTPFAVVLDALGVVRAKGTVNNLEQVEGLVETARRRGEAALSESTA